MSEVKHILLDIGVVLLHLDYGPAMARIIPLCDSALHLNSRGFFGLLQRDPMLAEYELGHLTTQEFFDHFAAMTGFHGTFEQFVGIWRSIFRPNEPMIAFAKELAAAYPVYFLTNAGCLHVPHIYTIFPSLGLFTDDAVSCYLGAAKPDRAFYEKALAKFAIAAPDCLFVDDRPENVAGAEACGIRSILYTRPEETIPAIRACLAAG